MSPYEVLGVPGAARPQECRAAYRRLLAEHHPDRWVDATAEVQQVHADRLREVTAAWMALRDVEHRANAATRDMPSTDRLEGDLEDLDDPDDGTDPAVLDDRPLSNATAGRGLTMLPIVLIVAAAASFFVSFVLASTALWQLGVALAVAALASFVLVPFFVMLRSHR